MKSILRTLLNRNLLSQVIFWSWNAVFLAFVYMGILPMVLYALIEDSIRGLVPWDFTLFSGLLMAIPAASVACALVFLRREPAKLIRLFYGIEAPLFLLCLARLFLVREMTPGVAQLLVTLYLGAFFYFYEVLRGYNPRPLVATLQLCGHTAALLAALYISGLLLFYAPPAAWAILRGFFSFGWLRELISLFRHEAGFALLIVPIGMLLFLYSALLFIGAPLAIPVLYVRSFRRIATAFSIQFGMGRTALLSGSLAFASLAAFAAANQQPQATAFALLSRPPRSDAERQALLRHSDKIRAGLLNAYLSPYRYLSSVGENNHVQTLYDDMLDSTHVRIGAPLQQAQSRIAQPFLYQGTSMETEQERAEHLYEKFFDVPIQKGDQAAVLRALEATSSRDERQAGLLNQGQRKVWLSRQEVRATEHGDWAEVELHEVYENQTPEPQEVFYYFTLPPGAAVTGLWLGDSEKREVRFPFTVAPRGAAQKIYRQEVARRRDPALLEQVGPRQYRLRAFPIPARPRDRLAPSAPPLHLWLTYKTFSDEQGIPLPRLLERRNVYWTFRSDQVLSGTKQRRGIGEGTLLTGEWLPSHLSPRDRKALATHECVLPGGVLVRAQPAAQAPFPPAAPRQRSLAVVLDRSRSMERVGPDVQQALSWVRQQVAAGSDIDLYLTASAFRGEGPQRLDHPAAIPPGATLFFGSQRTRELIQQFNDLHHGKTYQALLVLTDDGSLDLAKDEAPALAPGSPLWLVHLSGRLSPGYDDATLLAIQQSGGGAAESIDEALRAADLYARAAAAPLSSATAAAQPIGLSDGLLWTAEATQRPESPDDGFAALAARQLILARTRSVQRGDAASLDGLHQLAVRYGIVSPYSSMIVLVNDEQRERLKQAAEKSDRFDREVETGKQVMSKTTDPFHVTGAPEPQEWLLLGLVLCGLAYLRRRNAGAGQQKLGKLRLRPRAAWARP